MMQLFLAAALVLSATTALAQQQAVGPFGPSISTVFWTQSQGSLEANCSGDLCLASIPLFCKAATNPSYACNGPDPNQESVVCPLPKGGRCVFHIGLETSTQLVGLNPPEPSSNDVTGLYRFLIDGQPPTPGPVPNSNGYTQWGTGLAYASNYVSVVAVVTNTKFNQAHSIQMFDVCQNQDVVGCEVVSFRASARIDTFLAAL